MLAADVAELLLVIRAYMTAKVHIYNTTLGGGVANTHTVDNGFSSAIKAERLVELGVLKTTDTQGP